MECKDYSQICENKRTAQARLADIRFIGKKCCKQFTFLILKSVKNVKNILQKEIALWYNVPNCKVKT